MNEKLIYRKNLSEKKTIDIYSKDELDSIRETIKNSNQIIKKYEDHNIEHTLGMKFPPFVR